MQPKACQDLQGVDNLLGQRSLQVLHPQVQLPDRPMGGRPRTHVVLNVSHPAVPCLVGSTVIAGMAAQHPWPATVGRDCMAVVPAEGVCCLPVPRLAVPRPCKASIQLQKGASNAALALCSTCTCLLRNWLAGVWQMRSCCTKLCSKQQQQTKALAAVGQLPSSPACHNIHIATSALDFHNVGCHTRCLLMTDQCVWDMWRSRVLTVA